MCRNIIPQLIHKAEYRLYCLTTKQYIANLPREEKPRLDIQPNESAISLEFIFAK